MAIKTETLTIKVSPEEKEIIKKMAERDDVSVSKLLYRRLIKFVIQEEENNVY